MTAEFLRGDSDGRRRPPLQKIVLGSRGSELARAQTGMVATALRSAWPDLSVEIRIIKTRGDERKSSASFQLAELEETQAGSSRYLAELERTQAGSSRDHGRKGLFTGEIERALKVGEIDVAVHSAKDLPSDASEELSIRAVLPRAKVEDVLVTKKPGGFDSLGECATVASGSVRRRHQLHWTAPAIAIVDLRGNVPTRLRKLAASDWDGVVLARAGLERLGFKLSQSSFEFEGQTFFSEVLPCARFLPAGGQGVIALQVRKSDARACEIVDRVNHAETYLCLRAEREFLRLLQGDCDSPVGVLATIEAGVMRMRAQVFEPGRAKPRSGQTEGPIEKGGETLAAALFRKITAGSETRKRNVQPSTSNVQRSTKKGGN